MLREGDKVPDVELIDMDGKAFSPTDFSGQKFVLYFYPKDDTGGCTAEAQAFTALADAFEKESTWVIGVSKDSPSKHAKFVAKYGLKVRLATDESGAVCEAFGTWAEKSMYGRKYMGIDRTTFLVNRDGVVTRIWRKVKVAGHAEEVLDAAASLP